LNAEDKPFEENARELYENAPCGYLSSRLDGTIVGANETFLEWTGYSREELTGGKKFQDLLTVPGKIFYETQYAPLLQMQGFLKEVALDVVCVGRDPLPVLVNSARQDARGQQPILVRSTFFDATERRQYERDLLEARRHLEVQVRNRTAELQLEVAERSKAEQSLHELTLKLIRMQDEERRRLARDLHDSVGQLLSAASMNLSAIGGEKRNLTLRAAKFLAEADELVQQSLKEIRVVSYLLHPPLLDDSGLAPALAWYLEGFSTRSDIRVELVMAQDFGRLPQEMETAIFRVVQECLTNIHRHSGSKTATVRLSRTKEFVHASIEDAGSGMPVPPTPGVGLRGMRERIGQFGGELETRSSTAGTTIVAKIPAPL
jgi:PAS domain S-box-containing protein